MARRRLEIDVRRLEQPPRGIAAPRPTQRAHRGDRRPDPAARTRSPRAERGREADRENSRAAPRPAARHGIALVRIIHGKGTGTLKREVERLIARHPLVVTAGRTGRGRVGRDHRGAGVDRAMSRAGSDPFVEQVRAATDIVALIGAQVELKRIGNRFRGLRLLHREKTPSFYVSPDHQSCRACFGCGEEVMPSPF
ncbi:MAG: CHC2 zinc finger domain-containing protein [Candidatus Eisenbacteria bacterium]